MNLFEELSAFTMPDKTREICDQAMEISEFYTELGILGSRIKRCTTLIEMLNDGTRNPIKLEIKLRTKESIAHKGDDKVFKFEGYEWPDGPGTMGMIVDEMIEYLTTERITSWMAIEDLINNKIYHEKGKAKRKGK